MKRFQILLFLLIALVLVQLACNAPVPIPLTGTERTLAPVTTGTPGALPGITPTGGACTYKATFVSDVTVPDNTQVDAGKPFTKTWRVKNDGTCTWGPSGYPLHALVFVGGNQMGGPDQVPLPGAVPPGQTVDISVQLTAPTTPGTYIGQWELHVDNGAGGTQNVGVGQNGQGPLYVQVVVK